MGALQKRLIIIILLACGIVVYSFYGLWQKSSTEQIALAPAKEHSPVAANSVNKELGGAVVVYVSGGVSKPGVYKLAQGSRIVDAVNMAGGFAPGAEAAKINLALLLKDEMQVNVPYTVAAGVAGSATAGATGTSTNTANDKVNINTASAADLDKLPGIGPALAERIIQYRATNGLFGDLTDIKKVPGIGESKYNQFKDKISL
ncbi:MAG: comEA [Firmicutes bacterium]|nr:comEA [Bacillota bacterium]